MLRLASSSRTAVAGRLVLLAALAAAASLPAHAACDAPAAPTGGADGAAASAAPRAVLAELTDRARQRSQAVGAARLLAQAAQSDLDEARAGAQPQAALSIGGAWAGSAATPVQTRSGAQANAGLNLSTPLYDGGRVEKLSDWRGRLLEAARLGAVDAEEQVMLQTVALAIERSRQSAQAAVFGQYAQQMGCLVGALEEIVAADRGRASELVQARKTLGQALLQQEQSQAARRQIETRLARLVGPALPADAELADALARPPTLPALLEAAPQSRQVAQLDAQARAQESYAQALKAGQGPQLSAVVSLSRTQGNANPSSWLAGLSLNVPLLSPGADPAVEAARRRAEAARLQRDDTLEAIRQRLAEGADQLESAADRARRVEATLADSERVREATRLQWQQLGRRSLFDVMSAEGEHVNLRAARVNALHDGQQAAALLWSLGPGIAGALR